MAKRKSASSEAIRKIEPAGISAAELKSRIVRAIDEAIVGAPGAVRLNAGEYVRSDGSGTYTRPDRTLTRA